MLNEEQIKIISKKCNQPIELTKAVIENYSKLENGEEYLKQFTKKYRHRIPNRYLSDWMFEYMVKHHWHQKSGSLILLCNKLGINYYEDIGKGASKKWNN